MGIVGQLELVEIVVATALHAVGADIDGGRLVRIDVGFLAAVATADFDGERERRGEIFARVEFGAPDGLLGAPARGKQAAAVVAVVVVGIAGCEVRVGGIPDVAGAVEARALAGERGVVGGAALVAETGRVGGGVVELEPGEVRLTADLPRVGFLRGLDVAHLVGPRRGEVLDDLVGVAGRVGGGVFGAGNREALLVHGVGVVSKHYTGEERGLVVEAVVELQTEIRAVAAVNGILKTEAVDVGGAYGRPLEIHLRHVLRHVVVAVGNGEIDAEILLLAEHI